MSKISSDQLREVIETIKAQKRANFVETIDLQFKIKGFDLQKDKKVAGTVRLPFKAKKETKICVLADAAHIEEAQAAGIPFQSVDDLKKLNKDKKLVKKLAESYDAFLASESLIKQIPRILGPGLNKAGKFPTLLGPKENMVEKVHELECTIKFAMKKEINLGAPVGSIEMPTDEIVQNANFTINWVVSQLKKHWQNVESITIKKTMGAPQNIYS